MMTEFYQEDYRIRSVRIGEQSSLPGLEGLANVQQNTKAVLDEDDEIFLGYGFRSNVFPYRPQDVYTREQTERCYRSIVLENEFLRARFLPELGGRLISLTDKASGRDLLYQNKTLYAGNLAMRNSWFSGGVEWNASIIGHNPFTCSPLFCRPDAARGRHAGAAHVRIRAAARRELPDGFFPAGQLAGAVRADAAGQ